MPSTAVLMRILVLLFISLIFGGQIAVAQTMVTIDIQENGTAIWTMEKRLPLTTSEITEWESTIKNGQNIPKYQEVVKSEMDGFLSSAQNSSNRSMEIENFNISYDTIKTLNGGFGVIRYGFEWKNFSLNDSEMIYIGDVFSRGDILSSDITLVIKIPRGYEVQYVSPNPDKQTGNRLIWDHPVFDKGEPNLVLSHTVRAAIEQNTWPVVVPLVIVLATAGTLFIFWRKKRSLGNRRKDNTAHGTVINTNQMDTTGQIENTVTNAVQEDNTGINAIKTDITGINANQVDSTGTNTALTVTTGITTQTDSIRTDTALPGDTGIKATLLDNAGINVAQPDNTKSETAFTSLPDLANEILGDEEMIEQYLIKCGGQAYQSDIVEESGLSKSKISIVLAKMKEEGRILKIRKGKENIIRLTPKK